MAPSTTSQHLNQSSPHQETTHPPKRSLRNRGSNATITANSSQQDIMGGDSEVVVTGKPEFDGDGDARGKFPCPPSFHSHFFFPEKSKFPLRVINLQVWSEIPAVTSLMGIC